ncbi:MAG: extracellular solute-binding protein [Oscillospiraceae bacterium]|nr:extracellular solute-binding protein [Oscillospiraceae bacterium]
MKKVLAMILALVMIFALAACGQQAASAPAASNDAPASSGGSDAPAASSDKPLAGTYDITVWCPDAEVELRKAMIDEFNKTNEDGIVFNATVQNVGEGDAATQMITDVEAGADLYNFASDQFARLVQANALAKLGTKAAEVVKEGNSAAAVDAVTIGGEMYAYPLTDNGFFMYYDKSVISEDAVGSMDKIIEACEAAQKYLAFDVGNGWYLSAYFFGAGCVSKWSTDADGHWNVNDDFNSDKGLIAMKGLNKIQASPFHLSSSSAAEFDKGAAVVVTGLWDAGTAKEILGDNLGAAPLPSFTVDGTDYALKPFMGYKFIGVKTQTDAVKAAALHKLAQYLTSEEAQLKRFEAVTWAPVNLNAAASDAVKANPVIAADMLQQQNCTAQGQVNDGWWTLAAALGATAKETDDVDTYKAALQTYVDGLEKLKSLREGLLFVGAWNGWNNADEADTYILTGDGDVKSLTFEVPQSDYMGGRIVNIGSWENGMGAAQVKTGADLIQAPDPDSNPDNNIVFLAPGTYTVSIDTASGEISIVAG